MKNNNIIRLPHKFIPRKYQLDTFKSLFTRKYRNFIDIEHRRAGKDKKWINIMIAASQMKVGLYLYCLPTFAQAKKVIWKGRGLDGIRFIDHFPKKLIKSTSNVDLSVTLTNGSIFQLGGADNYNSWMGTNPLFVAFSEFSLMDPNASYYFRPILSENNGIQAYFFTPRGRNHAFHLWDKNKNNDTWYCQHLTVNDTCLNDGSPVIDKKTIEEDRKSGMSDELIEQEYYCSFDSSIRGAYFARALRMAREQNRILDFPIDIRIPINTYWDIGINMKTGKTAIWFIQIMSDRYNVVNYYENFNEGVQHYITYINHFSQKYGIVYQTHYAPHDVMKREWTTSDSIIKTAKSMGIAFSPVERVKHKEDAIEAARNVISKCYFHKTNCQQGLGALASYHAKYYDKHMNFGSPEHDWSSDAADSFMQFAQSYKTIKTKRGQIIYNKNAYDYYK